MPDRDDLGHAWRVSPSEYLKKRPATHTVGAPSSCYVTMRDGCKLAVDVYLPDARSDRKHASIVILTPYYRRFKLAAPGADPSPNAAKYRDFFVPRGYAMVVVDVRGCGASFGRRDAFRSPKERDDYREVADWIVAQPWSNGIIGATGISYLGAAACFLAATGHPAVKAIAPLFAVSDTYSDHLFAGGLKCTTVTETYDDLVQALDQDLRDRLARYPYFNDPRFAGPQPVDEDADGGMLRAAIEEHRDSFRLRDMAPELAYREEPVAYDQDLHSGACSPYFHLARTERRVAIYSVSGWYDGCAFVNGAISRFLTNRGPDDRLLLGPWDHGARTNGSPWRDGNDAQFPWLAELLRFFDEHLMGQEAGLRDEAPIHYHTVRAETWQAATQWPPVAQSQRLFLSADSALTTAAPPSASHVDYHARFTTGTGRSTRYERLGAEAVTDYYGDWNGREDAMLAFASAPFDKAVELTGHAIVHLRMSCSERDGGVFAYLSEVDRSNRSWYVTEGALRLMHRATAPCPASYRTTWPFRTFHRADARPMEAGAFEWVRFALLPVSWRIAPGSRLRLAIAGADADHFAQVPHGRPPRFSIAVGSETGSFIEFPLQGP